MNLLCWYYSQDLDISHWGRLGGCYSGDGRYRWTYCRRWEPNGEVVCWIGLNPGTSDDEVPKRRPTLRTIVKMSRDWGMSGLVLVNLFAWRATKPRALRMAAKAGHDIVGAFNDAAIEAAIHESTLTVAAWGNAGAIQNRAAEVIKKRQITKCLALTKRYHPRHPVFAKHIHQIRDLLQLPHASSVPPSVADSHLIG